MNNNRVEEVPDSVPADIPSSQGNVGQVEEVNESEAFSSFLPAMQQNMNQGDMPSSPDISDVSDVTVNLFDTQQPEYSSSGNTNANQNPIMMPADTQNEQLMEMMGMPGQGGMPPSKIKRDAILFGVYIACLRVAPLIIDYFSK